MEKPLSETAEYADTHFANLHYSEIQSLEYQLLLLADLAFNDTKQRKAFRQLIRRTIWFSWADNLSDKINPNMPTGMPLPEVVED